MKPPFVRNPYNYDHRLASIESGLKCDDLSLTVQSEADDADINTIVRRFGLTGELPKGLRAPVYGDFTGVVDYQSALNAIDEADSVFLQLPAEVRSRFDNDAAKFVDFCSNDANRSELTKLGLIVPPATPASPAAGDKPEQGASEGSSTGST